MPEFRASIVELSAEEEEEDTWFSFHFVSLDLFQIISRFFSSNNEALTSKSHILAGAAEIPWLRWWWWWWCCCRIQLGFRVSKIFTLHVYEQIEQLATGYEKIEEFVIKKALINDVIWRRKIRKLSFAFLSVDSVWTMMSNKRPEKMKNFVSVRLPTS